ncbi:MAG: aldo/keto reductase [Cyclobacteriaceae bacterium]|nr:aldo/keto reductase [Cyclobacteriaceae bacterium]
MEYNRLGKSGLQISQLSLGSWLTFGSQIEDSVAEEMMVYAYNQGVNFFDNAEVYAHGRSEIVMGKILKKQGWSRDSYIVSSKAFFGDCIDPKPTQQGLSRKHLTEACEAALSRLQLNYLDLYFCHRPDKEVPMEEIVWTMHNLIQQGKVLYWGTSEWSAQEIMEAHLVAKENHLIGPRVEQPQYNMFVRDKMEVEYNQIFKNIGMGTTIWSPLASGVLSGKYNGQDKGTTRLTIEKNEWLKDTVLTETNVKKTGALIALASELNISVAQLAIAWCLSNQNVSTVMLGATKLWQLKETLASTEKTELITDEVKEKIEVILNNKPVAPMF